MPSSIDRERDLGQPAGRASAGARTRRDPTVDGPAAGSVLLDASGTILAFDRGMERISGWTAFEVLGRSKDLGLYDEPDETGCRGFRPRPLFEGPVPQVDRSVRVGLQLTRRDGTRLDVDAIVSPVGGLPRRIAIEVVRVKHSDAELAHAEEGVRREERSVLEAQLNSRIAAARLGRRHVSLLVLEPEVEVPGASGEGKRIALAVRATLRQSDIVAALEGDRIAILLDGAGRIEARAIATRLAQSLSPPVTGTASPPARLAGVRVGIATYPADAATGGSLLRAAEEVLAEPVTAPATAPVDAPIALERRPRVAVATPVYIEGAERTLLGMSQDLSQSGMFVETRRELPLGVQLGLTFRLPGQAAPVRVTGRVARAVPPRELALSERPGVGIAFERFGDADRARLHDFIEIARRG